MTEIPVRRSLDLAVEVESIELVLDALSAWWINVGDVDPRVRFGFDTAVIEIAGNVVEHAPAHRGPGRFSVELTADARTVSATVSDDADPVDVDLSAPTMADVDQESGRGLALARAGVDRLRYQRVGDRNVWRLESERA
ncbi:ATP-binding protein [Microbacterium enclense]|uniref:ATP-binding protein n=1 Tax=Microbacterium enclense TaxID=993073 RepID=UPI0036DB17BD